MIPHTPLSFARHVTLVDAYREELHTDIRQSLHRFEIEAAFNQRFPGEQSNALQRFFKASFEIERAAFAARDQANPSLKVSIKDAATAFFDLITPHLMWEIEHKAQLPNEPDPQKLPADVTLLECVYLLFYSPGFRARTLKPPTTRLSRLQAPSSPSPEQCINAWNVVHNALLSPTFDRAEVLKELSVLMRVLSYEYSNASDPIWTFCW
jgi:hypothetical protein